jgi:long-chain fatty acid transport protein
MEVRMNNGKRSFAALLALLVLVPFAWGNGLNLNSLGTRALTMGGAFVGLADDFSVVFWNPAGAAGFKSKYFGFYGTDLIPVNKYRLDVPLQGGIMTLVDAKTKMSHYLGGMAAYYHPVSDRLVLGIGVYTPSGLGANWEGSDFAALTGNKSYDWTSKVGMVSISPLIAYKISDMISIGATLNVNYGMFSIKMHAGEAELPVPPYALDLGQYEESMNGWGLGATFGVLVKPSQAVSFGLTVRTPSAVKFKGDAQISNLSRLGYSGTSGLHRDLTFPLWIAGGVAVHPMDKLLLTADVQWTKWSEIKSLNTDFTDPAWKALMRLGGQDVRKMDWSDKAQLRFGAEYLLSGSLALRGGYYHDPTPSPDTTMNVLLPSFTFNVVTFGAGYKVADLQLDFGLEYLMGKERNVDYIKTVTDPAFKSAMPGTFKMHLVVPNVSVGFRF